MRLAEHFAGTGQIAHPQADLTELVESLTRNVGQEIRQLLGRAPRLVLRLRQRTSQPKNPGAVNAADAREARASVWFTPGVRDVVPLRRPAEISQPLADTHHVAVDTPGRVWGQLASGS